MSFLKFGKFKNKQTQRGKFIVIDGIDGSGKSTQLKMLEDEIKINGLLTETIHFPQHGTPSAVMVDYYLAGRYGQLNPYAASIFYAVDRFDAAGKIESWLQEGKFVLSDRYVSANCAHQGGKIQDQEKRLKFFKWLDNLEYGIFKIPKADLNIILNVPAEAAVKLLKMRQEDTGVDPDWHEKDLEHLKASENIYKEIAGLFPNTKLVECVQENTLLPPQAIHNKVWEIVRRIVLKDYKK